MKTQGIIGALLLAVLSVSAAEGQEPIPVRRVEDIGALERFSIVLERAFVPGLKILAPLYAYDGSALCDGTLQPLHSASSVDGWAAIIVPGPRPLAYFHRSVSDAEAVAVQDWCSQGETDWQFATPSPIPDETVTERYLSREVERIAEQLR